MLSVLESEGLLAGGVPERICELQGNFEAIPSEVCAASDPAGHLTDDFELHRRGGPGRNIVTHTRMDSDPAMPRRSIAALL